MMVWGTCMNGLYFSTWCDFLLAFILAIATSFLCVLKLCGIENGNDGSLDNVNQNDGMLPPPPSSPLGELETLCVWKIKLPGVSRSILTCKHGLNECS